MAYEQAKGTAFLERQIPPPTSRVIKGLVVANSPYEIPAFVTRVEASTSGAGTAVALHLPPAESCPGAIIHCVATAIDTTNVTVVKIASTIATLDTTGDDVIVVSDGEDWIIIGGTYT